VLWADQSISIDSLALVSPKLHKVIRLLDSFMSSLKDTLEHVGEMTHIELIMEVDRSLLERSLDFLVQVEGSLNHHSYQLLHRALILGEVLVEECTENREQRLLLWELNRTQEEMALKTWVHDEGTSCGVHGSDIHCALDLLDRELRTIVPMLVVLVLTNESNGALRVVFIEGGHVEVIDEVNELVFSDRTINLTSPPLKLLLKDSLKQH